LDPTTSTSSPPFLPTSSHCLSLDTISYIKVSPFYLSSLSFSQAVWNTLDDVEADSCLPPHFRAYCCISKYIYYFYMPFADVLLCFACPPSPTTWFFSTSTWMSHQAFHLPPTCAPDWFCKCWQVSFCCPAGRFLLLSSW
jgi:hypothetical protein